MNDELFWQLIARELSGEASATDEEKLEKYFAGNKEYKAIYNQLKAQWKQKQHENDGSDSQEVFRKFWMSEIIEKELNELIEEKENTIIPEQQQKKSAVLSYTKYAAVLLLFIGFTVGFWILEYKSNEKLDNQQYVAQWVTKYNPKGQKSTITLPDRSVVKLNANSKLIYPAEFEPGKREVILEGEAFFKVEKDKNRPFTIKTGEVTTTVLGTSFNINAYSYNKKIKIAVVTGKVTVANKETEKQRDFVLESTEMLAYDSKSKDFEKSIFDPNEELGWQDEILQFKDAGSQEIVEKLENWYGVKIHLTNGTAIPGGFTGSFKEQSLEHVLEIMGAASGFGFEISEDEVTIFLNRP